MERAQRNVMLCVVYVCGVWSEEVLHHRVIIAGHCYVLGTYGVRTFRL